MNINDLSNSKYLKGKDVPEPILVTIKSIELTNVAKESEAKQERPVVHFRECEKPMVFNSTNLKRAAKALGSEETDEWIGKRLVVYFDEDVEFGGEIVGGLRVRKVQGRAAQEAPTPPPADRDPEF